MLSKNHNLSARYHKYVSLTFLFFLLFITNIKCQITIPNRNQQWLPQTYSTFHWLVTDPGRWEADYFYHIHYFTDGRIKAYFQLSAETSDTLFKTVYDYSSNDLTLSQEKITTYQYGGNDIWIPISLTQEKTNIHNDVVENAHFSWSNSTAWIQQNGVYYDYIYDANNMITRVIKQEYSSEEGRYINSEREVFYYDDNNLVTWLLQCWNSERNVWRHRDRIDAHLSNENNTPDKLTYKSYQDSTWLTTSSKEDIIWNSYNNFINNYHYESYDLLYPYGGHLQVFYRYTYEYLENNSVIKTGMQRNDSVWDYKSRLTETYDTYGNLTEIHNEKWDLDWYTTYRIKTHYTWDNDKLLEQYTERYDISTTAWENTNRIVYSDHSMTSISTEDLKEGIRIYPNPAEETVKLEFPWPDLNIEEAGIYTIGGTLVHPCGRITPGAEIRVGDLQPGIYILRIRCGPPTFHTSGFKFVKLPF